MPCPSNCKVCSSSSYCTACNDGYYIWGGSCSSCGSGCKTCTSTNNCKVCSAGYYGYLKVCYTECPSASPTVFADDESHLCV